MSTVQHEAIGRLLDIWLASLDWSKSGQSNAIVWIENVVSREHRNQQINHLLSINFFLSGKQFLKFGIGAQYITINDHWATFGMMMRDKMMMKINDHAAGRIGWRIKKKELQARVCQESSIRFGGGNILEEFFFSSRDGSSFSSAINPNPPKRQKDEIENEPDDFKT